MNDKLFELYKNIDYSQSHAYFSDKIRHAFHKKSLKFR